MSEQAEPKSEEGTVSFVLTVSPKFKRWLVEERKRTGLLTWRLADELALIYTLNTKGAASWPDE